MHTCTECAIQSDIIMHPNSKAKTKTKSYDLKLFKYLYHEIEQCCYLPLIAQYHCCSVLLPIRNRTVTLLCSVAIYP